MLKINVALGIVLLGVSGIAWALPPCLDNSRNTMDLNNEQVLNWKQHSQDQFHARGYVKGTLTRDYPDHSGHTHFEMQIGPHSDDTIEVIYNQSFGELPALNPGMEIEVCGDYITTGNQGHDSSPDGAIIHWVHKSPSGNRHPSGYVAVNGVVYGEGDGNGN